jgi:predicted ester cyclase
MEDISMANEDSLREFYLHWYNEINRTKSTDIVAQYTAPQFVEHTPSLQGEGIQTAKQNIGELLAAFPDFHVTVEDVMAEGDIVSGRIRIQGTHQGSFQGIPPTGAKIDVVGLEWGRVLNNKWVEHWLLVDALSLMVQLGFSVGATTPPEESGGDYY